MSPAPLRYRTSKWLSTWTLGLVLVACASDSQNGREEQERALGDFLEEVAEADVEGALRLVSPRTRQFAEPALRALVREVDGRRAGEAAKIFTPGLGSGYVSVILTWPNVQPLTLGMTLVEGHWFVALGSLPPGSRDPASTVSPTP